MQVNIISFSRLFPATRVPKPQTECLSIIETFATHSTAEGLWFYDGVKTCSDSVLVDRLQKSLGRTLDTFPQYSGRLTMNTESKDGGHTERCGRLKLNWGTDEDLGVGFTVAKATGKKLCELVPPADQRRSIKGGWDRSDVPTASLLPAAVFRPSLITFLAQVTTFECGGFTIGITTTHALMDGQCLSLFLQHWSREYNLMYSKSPPEHIPATPVFGPQLLDEAAAGDIDGKTVDPELVAKALTLPHPHHEDSGTATNGVAHHVPEQAKTSISKVFHLTGDQVDRIHEAANAGDVPVGRQQALIAYIWKAVNRARGFGEDERQMNLGMPLDLRRRLGLPLTLLGSPVIHADIHLSGQEICSASLSELGGRLKKTFARYDADTLKALLHMLAFEENPQKYAGGAGGLAPERNLIVSVIPRMGFYDAVFEGIVPTFVTPMTVLINGLVMVMDARPTSKVEPKNWSDGGIDLLMTLEAETMTKLASDEDLWSY